MKTWTELLRFLARRLAVAAGALALAAMVHGATSPAPAARGFAVIPKQESAAAAPAAPIAGAAAEGTN